MSWWSTSATSFNGFIEINQCCTLLTPAALTVHSLALDAVLEWHPLCSAKLQSIVVVPLLTPANLTVHSLGVGVLLNALLDQSSVRRTGNHHVNSDGLPLSVALCVQVVGEGSWLLWPFTRFLQFAGVFHSDYYWRLSRLGQV